MILTIYYHTLCLSALLYSSHWNRLRHELGNLFRHFDGSAQELEPEIDLVGALKFKLHWLQIIYKFIKLINTIKKSFYVMLNIFFFSGESCLSTCADIWLSWMSIIENPAMISTEIFWWRVQTRSSSKHWPLYLCTSRYWICWKGRRRVSRGWKMGQEHLRWITIQSNWNT